MIHVGYFMDQIIQLEILESAQKLLTDLQILLGKNSHVVDLKCGFVHPLKIKMRNMLPSATGLNKII